MQTLEMKTQHKAQIWFAFFRGGDANENGLRFVFRESKEGETHEKTQRKTQILQYGDVSWFYYSLS